MSDSEDEPTAVMITIRLMPLAEKSGEPEEHNVKVIVYIATSVRAVLISLLQYAMLVVKTYTRRSQPS